MEALIVVVMVLGAVAAASFEMRLVADGNPRRFLLAWAAWTPVAAFSFAAFWWGSSRSVGALALTLAAAPLAYPACRAFFVLERAKYSSREEAEKEAERLKYHAMDFGGVARPPPQETPSAAAKVRVTLASPMISLPSDAALGRITSPREARLVRAGEIVVILLVGLAGVAFMFWNIAAEMRPDHAYRREAVTAMLEDTGYQGVRVEADNGVSCAAGYGYGYRWAAIGVAGDACSTRYGEDVQGWVRRRWPPMPPPGSAPAFPPAVIPVSPEAKTGTPELGGAERVER